MKIVDAGVKENSFMDFTIPTEFAKRTLYYMPQYGHFLCDSLYRIERETLDWFLLIYIRSGALYLESEGSHYTAPAGSVVFLDCRYPHCYFCKDAVDFLWLHFCGNNTETYAELLGQPRCSVFPKKRMETLFKQIFARTQGIPCNEHLISADIHRLLGKLAWSGNSVFSVEPLAPALEYIRNHFDTSIQLQQLADMCSISPSHFIRLFQQSLGYTPHEYLVAYRLMQAKQMLLTNQLNIEQIAELCGFHSASHFARAFRKNNGISPSEFKQMRF